jgi:glycerol-3-phosphate acyltransferase PlsY
MIMTILTLIGIFILGYALGNFSPAYLFGKWAGGVDIREKGSGNAGATNVMRVLGWRYGLLVFVLDALKGLAAVAIGMWLGGNGGLAAAAVGVILGHDFPILLNFRGGKGIASSTGILMGLFPVPTLIGVLIFLLVVRSTRMVSLGSLVFILGMALYAVVSGQPAALMLLAVSLALFAFLRHRENIRRILAGEENRLSY